MMTRGDVEEILRTISYKPGWYLDAHDDGHRVYLQVGVLPHASAAKCARTGEQPYPWKGGKHYLSKHMCRQEIVGMAYKAFKAAEEHELHEWFKYRGVAIFDPHLDPDKLVEFAGNPENRNTRDG